MHPLIYFKTAISFLIITTSIFAQRSTGNERKLYIAKTYTEFGEPIGAINAGVAETEKTYSIILSNGGRDFKEHIVFLFIEKHGNKNPLSQFSKLIRTEKGKSFVAFNYSFTDAGKYDIYFTDFARNKLVAQTITVKTPAKNLPGKAVVGESRASLNIIFCKRVIGELPIDFVKSVSLNNDGGEVYFFISDEKPLGTNVIIVSAWKKKLNAGFDQFMSSKKFQVNSDWLNTFFKYRFESPGEYKINIYDENEILLKSAYIAVEK